jgi:hypothetical protein
MAAIVSRRSFLAATAAAPVAALAGTPGRLTYVVILCGPSKRRPRGEPRVAHVVNEEELARKLTAKLNRHPGRRAIYVALEAGRGGVA